MTTSSALWALPASLPHPSRHTAAVGGPQLPTATRGSPIEDADTWPLRPRPSSPPPSPAAAVTTPPLWWQAAADRDLATLLGQHPTEKAKAATLLEGVYVDETQLVTPSIPLSIREPSADVQPHPRQESAMTFAPQRQPNLFSQTIRVQTHQAVDQPEQEHDGGGGGGGVSSSSSTYRLLTIHAASGGSRVNAAQRWLGLRCREQSERTDILMQYAQTIEVLCEQFAMGVSVLHHANPSRPAATHSSPAWLFPVNNEMSVAALKKQQHHPDASVAIRSTNFSNATGTVHRRVSPSPSPRSRQQSPESSLQAKTSPPGDGDDHEGTQQQQQRHTLADHYLTFSPPSRRSQPMENNGQPPAEKRAFLLRSSQGYGSVRGERQKVGGDSTKTLASYSRIHSVAAVPSAAASAVPTRDPPAPAGSRREFSSVAEKAALAFDQLIANQKSSLRLGEVSRTEFHALHKSSSASSSVPPSSWVPHQPHVTSLFREWSIYMNRWKRRLGATPSSLLSSFLCFLIIDDDVPEERALTINRVVMDEVMEVTADGVVGDYSSSVNTKGEGGHEDEPLTFMGFSYLLRNIAVRLLQQDVPSDASPRVVSGDDVAALRTLLTIMQDRIHRVHY